MTPLRLKKGDMIRRKASSIEDGDCEKRVVKK
jgi:hypothetical protein